jgi:hypothetical protein
MESNDPSHVGWVEPNGHSVGGHPGWSFCGTLGVLEHGRTSNPDTSSGMQAVTRKPLPCRNFGLEFVAAENDRLFLTTFWFAKLRQFFRGLIAGLRNIWASLLHKL